MAKRKRSSHRPAEDMALQITSMADVFTILLVFLLKSYSTGPQSISPNSGMKLPKAKNGSAAVETLKVEVSVDSIEIEGKKVASLSQFQVNPAEVTSNGTIASVNQAIAEQRLLHPKKMRSAPSEGAAAMATAPAADEDQADARITIMADMKVPYSTLKTVLASAANYGFTEYKLVVVKDE